MAKGQRLRTQDVSLDKITEVKLMLSIANPSPYLNDHSSDPHMQNIFRHKTQRFETIMSLSKQVSLLKGIIYAFQQQLTFR